MSPRIERTKLKMEDGRVIPYTKAFFASVSDVVDVEKGSKSAWAPEQNRMVNSVGDSSAWFYRPEFEVSKADIIAGWPEGVKSMLEARSSLARLMPEAAAAVTERMETVWDTAGDDVCVGRYLDSEPECMGTGVTVTVPAQGRVVSVVVMAGFSSAVKAESIAKVSVGVMAIIDAIEATGMRCEVSLVFPSFTVTDKRGEPTLPGARAARGPARYTEHAAAEVWIQCKRAEDALDMGAMAAALHPDTFRRFVLSYWRRVTDGRVGDMSENTAGWDNWRAPKGSVVINAMKTCDKEPANWVPERMKEIMKELGMEA